MRVLNNLTLKGLKLNKKRTIGTIIGIILSVSLICAIAGMGTSFRATLINGTVKTRGYNHLVLEKVTNDDVEKLELNREFKRVYTTYDLGYASFDHDRDENQPFIHIYSLGDIDIKDIGGHLTSGRMPKSNSELVVTENVLRNGHLNIGDIITLEVGRRKTNDGYDLDDSNPYHKELEKLVDTTKKTYRIVGSINVSNSFNQYIGYTAKETRNDYINAYIALKDPFKHKKVINNLLKVGGYKDYIINNELLRWEAFSFSDSTVSSIISILCIVIFIVVVASVFCIRNSFAISTTEKIKMYGMLASIGATKKQIKKCVIKEGLMLSLIGIPLGVLSGILADFVLINVINLIAGDFLFTNSDAEFTLSINYIPVVVAIILGLITVYLSSISSARKASKVSPIQNLRNSNEIKIKSKKLKTPKIINCIFKTGGTLAYKNLKRSKKKYRTTIISLTVSIFVFITMTAFINVGFKSAGIYYTDYDYNIKLSGIGKFTNDDIKKVKELEDYKLFAVKYDAEHYLTVSISNVNEYFIDNGFYDEYCDIDEKNCENKKDPGIQIVALDHESYLNYLKNLKIKSVDAKNKGILVDNYLFYEEEVKTMKRIYDYKKGDTIKGTINEKIFSIDIAQVTESRPVGMENTYYLGGYIVVDYDDYKDLDYMIDSIMIETNNPIDISDKIEDMYPSISVYNIDEAAKAERAVILIISIFLYGFIAVITLIGVTNIFNTITSNMELRQKEFAMLKSIGMTKHEFNRMINLETLFYSSKSLIYGIVLGIIGSYLIHNASGLKNITKFTPPINAILISIIFVFILVYIIMRYSISKINKQNIIETIRKDNI